MSRDYSLRLASALLFLLAACAFAIWVVDQTTSLTEEAPRPAEAQLTSDFLNDLEEDWVYKNAYVPPEEVRNKVRDKGLKPEQIRDGALRLLDVGTTQDKARAAEFLGSLGDASTMTNLLEAANDPDPSVRVAVCHAFLALSHRSVSTHAASGTLKNLRAHDPTLEVWLAATTALQQPGDPESIAVFKAGVASGNPWIRGRCEDELDKQGHLQLPLAEHVYEPISYEGYKQRKFGSWRDKVLRETRKNGKIYFEYEFRSAHGPWLREWYRTEDPDTKAEQVGK